MQNKRLLLIVNPCSGKAKMHTELLKVVEVFSKADYSVLVYPTKSRGDATEYIKTIDPNGFDLITVCGGDGTLNEVIAGMMEKDIKIPIGYIPAGTLNEWSSGLKISRNIETAAKNIVTGREIKLDIGRFDDKYFTYTASFGAFTSASYSTPQSIKNRLGKTAYFFEGFKEIANIKSIPLKVTTDNEVIEGEFLFGAISNSLSVGSVVKYDKVHVDLNDGLFEVVLIRNPKNITKYPGLIDDILKHKFDHKDMVFFRTNKVTIESKDELAWTLDGEYAKGDKPITIENIHSAITFIVPQEPDKK